MWRRSTVRFVVNAYQYDPHGSVVNYGNTSYQSAEWRMEELAKIGISYTRPDGTWADAENWVTTENALRAEHGYGRRVKY